MENRGGPSDRSKASQGADLETLRELVRLMNENDLVELEYQSGGLLVRLGKERAAPPAPALPQPSPGGGGAPAAAPQPAEGQAASAPGDEAKYLKVVSPMVGTFYAAPSPDSAPFVTVGDTVNENTVVCLIEAMKVYNEIKAGVSGKIVRVAVKNEDAVEFGQVLFLVAPA